MKTTTRWALVILAAATVGGLTYGISAAAPGGYGMMAGSPLRAVVGGAQYMMGGFQGMMTGDMAAMHARMSGQMGAMHGQMSGDMAAMHELMAPLMAEMPALHAEMHGQVGALLGLTAAELDAAMAQGKSLAQIAGEQNVAIAEIQAAMTAAAGATLDRFVSEGKLTAEQKELLLGFMAGHMDVCLNDEGGLMQGMHSMMQSMINGGSCPRS